ncbi:MAG TPA: Ig-like domain-containing protein, partial [Pirellulales bacterium]
MFHIVRRWFSLEVLFRPLRPRKRWRQHRTTFAQRIESLHFESLERREMLAGDSSAQNGGSLNALGPHYNDLHDAPLIVDATYGVLAGASAPSGAPLSAILVDPPHHGSLTLNANGSFRYDPKPGYRGRDSFVFDETDVAGFHRRGIAELSVLEKWTPTQTTTVGGVRPLATPPEAVSISNTKGPEGAVLEFVISVSGAGPDGDRFGVSPGGTTPGMNQRDADPGGDFNESFQTSFVVYGSGSDTVDVQTYDDERDMAFGDADAVFGVLASNANANNLVSAQATGTILEKAISHPCTCSCSCGNVEAGDPSKPQTQGGSTANSGQGDAPQDLFYQGLAMPHPIITVNDTLSSTVAQASGIMVQTTLDDMEGNVLYTSPPVYYSPTGYSQNDPVQFAQQLDAAGLAHGQYQATTSVTEEYPNGQLPIIRNYVNLVGVDNLDASPYGAGWGLKNVDRLATQTNGAALLDGSGNVSWFDIDSSGNYDVPDSRPDVASFAQNPDSSFTLTYRDGSQENFAANGLLSSTVDKNNNTTTDSWNPDSTLASVTDQAGRTTTFAYAAGLLTSVTDFGNRVTTYSYSNDQLTSITLPSPGHGEGQHVTTMGYDPTTGMLTTITDAGGTTTLAYNSFRQVIKITNPDSTSTEYTAPSSMSLVNTSGGLGTQSDPAPLVYTVSVQGSVTDGNGHRSTYATDATTGEILETVDATGVTTGQYQYNDAGQVTSIIQPPLTSGGAALTTTLGYDSNGNLNQETFPDGTSETWTYDQTWNEPTQYVDPAGRETDYTLDPNNGDVLSVTQVGQNGDANRVTTYTYTANPSAQGQTPGGLVATMTDPRGVQTAFSYNSHGLVTQITYAVGTAEQASVSFTYDANDNPASYTNELGQTTLFVYDNSNRKIAEQDPPPDPSQPSVRPTWTWTYDTRGNKLSQTDPLGRVTSYVYGPGSDGDDPDLDKVIQPDPTGGTNYTITTYGHDNADNLTSITDPLERVQSMGFDADNRQTSITLPNPTTGGSGGPTESVVYNALGFPVQQFDLAGNETDNTFNWRGQVLTSEGPPPTPGAARPVETFTYNADGQVLTDQNALGGTTQYVYNSFGEVTEEIFPSPGGGAQPTLHWTYDPDGNVASYQDANGNIYTYTYSDRNQLIQENAPSPDGGHTPAPVWQWVYDTAGQLTETIDPMQRVTQFVPDGDGNVIQTIAPNLTTGGAGDASTTTYATYNLDNEKTSETTPLPSGATGTATTSWQYNDLGQMTQETQPVPAVGETAPVWKYQVDADNELLQVTNPLGLTQTSTFNGL